MSVGRRCRPPGGSRRHDGTSPCAAYTCGDPDGSPDGSKEEQAEEEGEGSFQGQGAVYPFVSVIPSFPVIVCDFVIAAPFGFVVACDLFFASGFLVACDAGKPATGNRQPATGNQPGDGSGHGSGS